MVDKTIFKRYNYLTMTIKKAIYYLLEFTDNNLTPVSDYETFDKSIIEFFKHKRFSNRKITQIKFLIDTANANGFLELNENAMSYEEMFSTTKLFAEYVLKIEDDFIKFKYGLIGSVITIVGGLIGALIAALL